MATEVAAAATETPQAEPKPERLSYSKVSKLAQCPEAYRLQFVERVGAEPSLAALAGSAIHEIIEELLIGAAWWRAQPGGLRPYLRQAFAVKLGVLAEGGEWHDPDPETGQAGHWTWDPIEWDGRHGVDAVRVGGQQRIVVDDEDHKVQAACPTCDGNGYYETDGGRLPPTACMDCDTTGLATEEYRKRNGELGRRPVWLKAGEDLRWWCQQGPLMLMRAASLIRKWHEQGVEITKARVEMSVTTWLHRPGEDPAWPYGLQATGKIDVTLLEIEGQGVDLETGEITDTRPVIVDWKSGTWTDDWQVVNYAWLFEEAVHQRVDLGMIVPLRKDGPDLEHWIEITPERRAMVPVRYEQTAQTLARQPDKGPWLYAPNNLCGSCWVRAACGWWAVEGGGK